MQNILYQVKGERVLLPTITAKEWKSIVVNKIFKYVDDQGLVEINRFMYRGLCYSFEYRSGCFNPFLECLGNADNFYKVIPKKISLGIFQQIK